LAFFHGGVVFTSLKYAFEEPTNSLGLREDHWFQTTLGFTLIIHIIVYKLLIETDYWHPVSVAACLLCFILYYSSTFLLSTRLISALV
jgi:quinol-cytochrome oxidoreductase complex cytochrome b subunit